MDSADAAKIRAQIKEARQQLSDLMRNLDESPAFEQEERINAQVQRVRERVLELERALAKLESA